MATLQQTNTRKHTNTYDTAFTAVADTGADRSGRTTLYSGYPTATRANMRKIEKIRAKLDALLDNIR